MVESIPHSIQRIAEQFGIHSFCLGGCRAYCHDCQIARKKSVEKQKRSKVFNIPGFGPDVSSKTFAAIGNPFRFETGKQVLKMAGYDLSADRSGKTSNGAVPVISKKGKADLRYALYQAAFEASTQNTCFMIYYTNKLRGRERQKGIRTKMRVKLASKLLIIAWTLMKKRRCLILSI